MNEREIIASHRHLADDLHLVVAAIRYFACSNPIEQQSVD
jgi:hypothetical protein